MARYPDGSTFSRDELFRLEDARDEAIALCNADGQPRVVVTASIRNGFTFHVVPLTPANAGHAHFIAR